MKVENITTIVSTGNDCGLLTVVFKMSKKMLLYKFH